MHNFARQSMILRKYWLVRSMLWASYWQTLLTGAALPDLVKPHQDDPRFTHDKWVNNAHFSFIKQSYLLLCRYHMDTADELTLSPDTKQRTLFLLRQWLNSMSPTNFPFTNPEVIEKTKETSGSNLLAGLQNALEDLQELALPMVEKAHFKVGKNIACTKGSVVSRTKLMELIHYPAQGQQIKAEPILITPPWINKYYILDISPQKSMVEFLTEAGFDVFIQSWKNPTLPEENFSFEDYLTEGISHASEYIKEQLNSASIHYVGYCLGGTLTAMYLGSLEHKVQASSATLLATLTDFTDAGQSAAFFDEKFSKQLALAFSEQSYIAGNFFHFGFRWLRANHLIWPQYISRYFLNKPLIQFDILYWNCDSTNMPKDMFSEYIQTCYVERGFADGKTVDLGGTTSAISHINCPLLCVGAEDDHITPWQSTYKTLLHHNGEKDFILSTSGHILGIVNPPSKSSKRYFYRASSADFASGSDWFDNAQKNQGSWWGQWVDWLENKSTLSKKRISPAPIMAAPGRYVLE